MAGTMRLTQVELSLGGRVNKTHPLYPPTSLLSSTSYRPLLLLYYFLPFL